MDASCWRKGKTLDASNAEVSSVSEDGAGGGTRTHTESPPADFESATSTIPSHRHILSRNSQNSHRRELTTKAIFYCNWEALKNQGFYQISYCQTYWLLSPLRLPIPSHRQVQELLYAIAVPFASKILRSNGESKVYVAFMIAGKSDRANCPGHFWQKW